MKINLAVLFGGKSVEHEISVISALQAMGSLDKEKYRVYPVYITKDNGMYYGECLHDINMFRDIPSLLKKCEEVYFYTEGSKTFLYKHRYRRRLFSKTAPVALIDAALPVVHGTNTEDGSLQGFLRTLNLPFAGCDVLSSAVCMDKYMTKIMLKSAGIPVLDCLRFSFADASSISAIVKATEKKFGYPVIIKPVNLGSSVGISRADDAAGLREAVDTAFLFADFIIIEPAVVNLREINCSVLGDFDEALPSECEEPCASEDILSYSDKYLEDGSKSGSSKGMASLKRKIPADIPSDLKRRIQESAVEAFKFLGCSGVIRIDFLTDRETGEFWLNEINTIPGSLSFYLWEPAGLKYSELLDKLVGLALKRQRKDEDKIFSFDTNILSSGGAFGSKGSKGSSL